MRRLLLTGAAGRIATAVRPVLRGLAGEVVLTDRVDVGDLAPGERFVRAELADPAPWDGLAVGCEAVVHLAAVPDEAAFHVLAGPNLHGAFHVYEAARRAGVRRVVAASSGRATGFYRVGERLDGSATPRPDGLYAATKAFSEALGRMYADRFGLEVVALRIGTFAERPRTERDLSTWLSPGRCAPPGPGRADRAGRRLPGGLRRVGEQARLVGSCRRPWATCRAMTPRPTPVTSSRPTASRSRAGRTRCGSPVAGPCEWARRRRRGRCVGGGPGVYVNGCIERGTGPAGRVVPGARRWRAAECWERPAQRRLPDTRPQRHAD